MSVEINNIKNNSSPQPSSSRSAGIIMFKSKPIPNDKAELSSKKELSTVSKIGIGIGIVSIAGLGIELIWGKGKHLKTLWEKICGKGVNGNGSVDEGKKYFDKIDDIKENFSKIFGRDYTKDEAQELALKYKEIFETENNNEFMKNFWLQINKDYKLPDIPYRLTEKVSNTLASFSPFGGVNYNTNEKMKFIMETKINNGIEEQVAKFIKVDRLALASCLAHELKHAKQIESSCRVDVQKTIEAYVERVKKNNESIWQKAMNICNNNISAAERYCNEELNRLLLPYFKNIEKSPIGSAEYQEGLRQIEGIRNYITHKKDPIGYWNQFVELEARDSGNRMEQIYKWLMNK